jgi:predicted enzyme related to lactoylglutathione lyase
MADGATSGVEGQLARQGKLSYVQIPALDVRCSAEFYARTFGWSTRDDGKPSHLSFGDASGDLIGAFVTDVAVSREPGVLPYIYVTEIDSTVRLIEGGGGEIVRAPYPEGDLWVATFRDPAGNVIGIWQMGPRAT